MSDSRAWCVTGAPGAGKTAVVAHLARLLPDFVVLDVDALLERVSRLAGVDLGRPEAAARWPAYNGLWDSVAAMLAAAHPVVLLGPSPRMNSTKRRRDRGRRGNENTRTAHRLDRSRRARRDLESTSAKAMSAEWSWPIPMATSSAC